MITDSKGNKIDDAVAFHRLVVSRDLRFPDNNAPGDRLGRLLAEMGELAGTILTLEHGTPESNGINLEAALTEAVYHVLRAAGGIAHHYQVPVRLPESEEDLHTLSPHVLFGLLTHAAGELARIIDQAIKLCDSAEDATSVSHEICHLVDVVNICALLLADHYEVRDNVRAVIESCYRNHQNDGFLR